MKKQNKIDEHTITKTFPKFVLLGSLITIINYTLGVFFINYLSYLFAIVGLVMIPMNFMIGYFINKNWAFKK